MNSPGLDLQQTLSDLCEALQIDRSPSIAWADRKELLGDGVYCERTHGIFISSTVPTESVAALVVHELCHAVLERAGYRSAGHSAIFMATNRLMLLKAGLEEAESIEGIAVRNWSSWTPWPHWYRHLTEAQAICESLSSTKDFVTSHSSQAIASEVLNLKWKSYKKFTPRWIVYRWHEIIADRRGPWFALQDVCRLLFAVSLLMFLSPSPVLQQMAMISLGLCTVGLFVLTRKFPKR